MTIYFSEVFKKLRQSRSLTQEQVADIFCVSPQAVSRWECGITTPDISLLPVIAEYFDVTIEEVLGVGRSQREIRIREYMQNFDHALAQGNINDCIEIARSAVRDFPNSDALLNQLMYALFVSGSDDAGISEWKENIEKYKYEIIELGEKILQGCTDDKIRMEVRSRLGFHYCEIGEPEKGRAVLEELPSIGSSREFNLYWALGGEERMKHISRQILFHAYHLMWNIQRFSVNADLAPEEKLEAMKKIEKIIHLIYQEDDMEKAYHLPRLYTACMAPVYLELGDREKAVRLLEKAVQYIKKYSEMPEIADHTTPYLSYVKYKKDSIDPRSYAQIILEDYLSKECFDVLREDKSFLCVAQQMRELGTVQK